MKKPLVIADPPPGPRRKIGRAKKHLGDLEAACVEYLGHPKPYRIVRDRKPDGWTEYRLQVLREPPSDIPLIFGDCIHNARSALDILVCDLIRHKGEYVDGEEYGFPICDAPQKLSNALKRDTRGAGEAAKEVIRRCKPYKRGNEDFWVLHALDIADKHNVVLTPLAAMSGNETIFPISRPFRRPGLPVPMRLYKHIVWPIDPVCAKDGGLLWMTDPTVTVTHDHETTFQIAVHERGVVKCEPIIPLAKKLIDLVEGVVHRFDPLFA